VPNAFEAQPQQAYFIVVAAVCGLILLLLIARARRGRRAGVAPVAAVVDGDVLGQLAEVQRRVAALEQSVGRIAEHLPHAVQGVGVVRYNPFPNMGGNMSFSLALLDGDANGVVLSVLNNRDSARVYGKPIEAGRSAHPLSAEELQALAEARGRQRVSAR